MLFYLDCGPTVQRPFDLICSSSLSELGVSPPDPLQTMKLLDYRDIIPMHLLELLFDDGMYFNDLYQCYVIPENGYSEYNTYCTISHMISSIPY